jgi:hypothetical protein
MRGAIKYLDRYKQSKLISYEGMERHRKITPTDIDGFIDYNGNAFVYMDAKLLGTPVQLGQRMALEHIIDSHCMAGHYSLAMIFEHDCYDSSEVINAKYCKVDTVYWEGLWRKESTRTVIEVIQAFENWLFNKGIEI